MEIIISQKEKLVIDSEKNTVCYTVSVDGVNWDNRVTFKRDTIVPKKEMKVYTCPICRTRIGMCRTCPCCGHVLHP